MTLVVRTAALALAVAGACAPRPAAVRLREDAYVWQRAWTPAVVDAVRARGRSFDALRVLALEIGDAGAVAVAGAPAALAGKRVIPVVRVDGSRIVDDGALVDAAKGVVARFRGEQLDVKALEIDHDCAASQLARYAATVRAVKAAVDVPVQITALPSWAPSPALDELLAASDAVTLQVHAVERPTAGLFSKKRARAAVDAFARTLARVRPGEPLYVALPAYGSAVAFDDEGTPTGVESEEPRALGPRVRELWAKPREVAAFLRALARHPPPGLAGIAWFRLPVDGDRRAWSFATLEAVRADDVHEAVQVEHDGVDVVVTNTGTVDALAPARIDVDAKDLVAADGVRGYAWDGLALRSSSPPRIRVGERLVVGWVRAGEVTLHAK